MEFTKIQGAGNDFIIINNIELKICVDKMQQIAKRLCVRKLSVGADGLMVVDNPDGNADFKMRFYNSDGSIGEMCGNGARCIARYAYINKIAGKHMVFETGAGLVSADILEGRSVKVKLNAPQVVKLDCDVEVNGQIYECSYIELGNPGLPHAVVKYCGLNDINPEKIYELGRQIRNHKEFPKGANVNFYDVFCEDTAVVRTFERGVEDFTLACGTGAGSTAVVLYLKGIIKSNKIKINMPGGQLTIDVVKQGDCVSELYLTGDTNIIAVGNIMDEDLKI